MTKSELLNEIEANSIGINSTEKVRLGTDAQGNPTYDEGTLENGTSYTHYISNVLVEDGVNGAQDKNIVFVVFDEGGVNEEARYSRNGKKPSATTAEKAVRAYLDSLVPDTYIRYDVRSVQVNEDILAATARAIKEMDSATAKWVDLYVFKNGGNPIEHREVVE